MRFPSLQRFLHLGLLVLAGFTLATLPGVRPACAQGIITGGISGTITDQTGAAIPNATIEAVSEGTGSKLQATSNSEGDFLISDVPLGTYTLTVTATNFGQSTVNHVQVIAGNSTPAGKIQLAPGGESQTVEVEGSAAELLNTESAQSEASIDAVQLASAPVSGGLDNMTLMVPGVVPTHSTNFSNTNGSNYSVNGQRGRSNNSEIDGQTNNDTSIGGPSFFFDNQDAIQEIQVVTTDMGAQYGRNMGAITNYITKAGTNSFHGTGFEIYTGSWLSSLTQEEQAPQYGFCPIGQNAACLSHTGPLAGLPLPKVPRFVQNTWGGTLGGPVLKNKLWFFGSTLWDHTFESGQVLTSAGTLFPDPNGLKTLIATYPNNPAVTALVDNGPYSSPAGNPTPIINTTTTLPVTDGITPTNVEVAQFERTFPTAIYDQEHLGRLDYQMTPADRFYLRYDYQNNPYNPAFYLVSPEAAAAGGYPNVIGITHEAGGDWTHTFKPTLINQLRYAFQQSRIGFYGGAIPTCSITNQNTCTSTVTMGAPLTQYGYGTNLPQGRFIKVNQIQDNATWTHGHHTIMFGGEYDYQNSPWGWLPDDEGAFNFTPGAAIYSSGPNAGLPIPLRNATGAYDNGLTGMLEGVAEVSLAEGSPTIPFQENDFDLYFQDNFKITNNLTLNLGLRYEFFGQAVNFLSNETIARQTGPHPFWSTALPLSATTVPHVNSDYRNLEPRLGFAYNPPSLPKMVIHGGFSMNADPEFYSIFVDMAVAAPAVNSGSFGCDGVTIRCLPNGGLTFSTVQAADDNYLPIGGDPRLRPTVTVPTNFRNPLGETWSVGFQYQVAPAAVASISYVGNHSFGLFQALNTNPEILTVRQFFPGYGPGLPVCTTLGTPGYGRENCNYGPVETFGNTAFSLYNALQTSLTVRTFHGFTGTASYTYSRTIDNASEFGSTGLQNPPGSNGGQTSAFAQDPLNPDIGERGVNGNSYPNIWGIQLTYNAPWHSQQGGIKGRALGGYYFNAFYTFNGGQPYNPVQNSFAVTSPCVLADITRTPSPSSTCVYTPSPATINPTEAEFGFADSGFIATPFGYNGNRPVLSNPNAPLQAIGINLGPGGYVDYLTGAPISPTAVHWLWSNQYQAIATGTPFPGVGRNILRGDSFSNLDLTVGKNIHLTERVNMLIQVSAFNALNRGYYGNQDPFVEDSLTHSFETTLFTGTQESGAAGGSYPQGLGNRNLQLTGKITF